MSSASALISGHPLPKCFAEELLLIEKGEGVWLEDGQGRRYLDFSGGIAVNALGHCNLAVVDAICDQAKKLIHCSNLYYIEPQVLLAKMLVENSVMDKVFFCNSGAEANEAAIKLARKYAKVKHGPEKVEIITALNSFHGRTLAAITATGQPKYQKNFEPLPAGFKYVPFNDLQTLTEAVGPETCAVMLEPIQGEGGVNVASKEYINGARKLCRKFGALLIFDEVQTGIGRTGRLFAYEHYAVKPDIITLAKALGGGFPIGAMLARGEAAKIFQPGDHASTFGGNPLACAAALATLEEIIEGEVVDYTNVVGEILFSELEKLRDKYDYVREIRGKGLLIGMELSIEGKSIVDACQEKGLLINCVGGNVLRFIPPLNISSTEVRQAIDILDEVMAGIQI